MAVPAERPPSEQGPEYQTLDLLTELQRQLADLAAKPAVVVNAAGNWWDVLPSPRETVGTPFGWSDLLPTGQMYIYALPMARSDHQLVWRVTFHADRLEMAFQLNGGWLVWQRALFYEGGPRG